MVIGTALGLAGEGQSLSLTACSLKSDETVCVNRFEDACPKGVVLWQSDAYPRQLEASIENCWEVKPNKKTVAVL